MFSDTWRKKSYIQKAWSHGHSNQQVVLLNETLLIENETLI
jgi:hypothetical protein